ncbi:MAG: hypothetical protein HQL87_17320 [Magnetococcales bacterium]|nr:hypothetical protein [Magnetococcales bacterium]
MHKKSTKQNSMRIIAEEQLVHNPPANAAAIPPVDQIERELRTHQIQLEIKDDELRRACVELATSLDRYVNLYDSAPVGYITHSRYAREGGHPGGFVAETMIKAECAGRRGENT